jgi:hypothetical protein
MTPTIIITATPEGYSLKFKGMTKETFTPAIETLKRTVSPNLREYEPDTKQWFVADAARTQLDRWLGHLFVTHGVEAEWLTSDDEYERARKPHTSAKADPFAALHLLPSAPMEVVRAAYKALAMKHHPDLGGDTQAMQRLNQAYKQISPAA